MNTITGDLLALADAGEFDIIVQGCNCFNTMGAGIALQIANRYPDAQFVDLATSAGDYNKLGNYTMATVTTGVKPFSIINAYTQYGVSNSGEDVFEYTSFEMILQKLAYTLGNYNFGLPMIGMGLAGGDPAKIMPIIESFAQAVENKGGSVTLVQFG